jgi:chaperone BCS1
VLTFPGVVVSELRSSTAEKAPSFLAADHTSSLPETPEVDMEQLAATFAMKITEFTFSPAEIQGYLLCHINSPLDAITHVESWVEKTLGEKKMKDAKIESQEEDKDTRNDQVKTNKKGKQSKPEKANMDGNNEEKDEGISGTETESDEESSDEEVKQPTGLYQ